jgi:hypothetical protein
MAGEWVGISSNIVDSNSMVVVVCQEFLSIEILDSTYLIMVA